MYNFAIGYLPTMTMHRMEEALGKGQQVDHLYTYMLWNLIYPIQVLSLFMSQYDSDYANV